MDSACGGFAACNSCRVDVLDGAEHLTPLLPEEEPFLDVPGQRLGCQARVQGPVHVRLAPGA
jgi:ferredoxin